MLNENRPAASRREVSFTSDDVELFATASGDRNPLHLDAGFARRTPFGACIVHGALVAIGLLGSLPPDELAGVRAVRLRFAGPVMPGAAGSVDVRQSRRTAGAWEARLNGRGKLLAHAVAGPERELIAKGLAAVAPGSQSTAGGGSDHEMRLTAAEPGPGELEPGLSVRGSYSAGPELGTLARRLGAEALDPALLEGLAWASYVVGMVLPGRHSLLAGFTVVASTETTGSGPAHHSISVREHDVRTGQLVLDCALWDRAGSVRNQARIECFAVTPAPAADPEALGLGGPVDAERGSVVVIGASRGFGAALTLALLGRGYRVHAVYSSSPDSAAELTRLAGGHRDRLVLHRLDAREPAALAELAAAIGPEAPLVGIVLGAAPAPLPMGLTGESAAELADYVSESLRLAAVPVGSLLPLLSAEGWVLFCSSPAILAPPRDWPHYVTAKAALEGLARWVAATIPSARAIILRPPAMRTELTNTPSGRIAAIPAETVAAWVAERLADDRLNPGLNLLEPDALVRTVT
jgi:NAD(P)-dependent dehydrogenase (short-subunit alcohol dehydrogenase family)/acyl dehydratase